MRVDVLERAAEAADRGAHAGHEDDGIAVCRSLPMILARLPRPCPRAAPLRSIAVRCAGTIGTDARAHLIDRGGAAGRRASTARVLERLARRRRASGGSTSTARPTSCSGSSARYLGFHPLAIEDAMHFGQRPKLDEYDDFVFLVVYGAAPDEDDLVEMHCFYSERYLVTVRRDDCPAFAEARERYARRPERLEEPALVLYRVVDGLVDSFFPLLTDVRRVHRRGRGGDLHPARPGAAAPHLPDEASARAALRRVIAPERDLVASLASGVIELPGRIGRTSERSFRDVYDHLIRLTDTIDSYRDLLTGADRRVPLHRLEPAERRDQAARADRDDLPAALVHHRLLRPELRVDGRRGRRRGRVLGARRRASAARPARACSASSAAAAGSNGRRTVPRSPANTGRASDQGEAR